MFSYIPSYHGMKDKYLSWDNNKGFGIYVQDVCSALNPIQYQDEVIQHSDQSVEQISFANANGMIDICFLYAGKVIPCARQKSIYFGLVEISFEQRSDFTYKANGLVEGFFLNRMKWKEIMKNHKDPVK
jgi:hypothetical protein